MTRKKVEKPVVIELKSEAEFRATVKKLMDEAKKEIIIIG